MSAEVMSRRVVIIGGGPAGLAAAVRLHDRGVRDVLIIEREHRLGGILRQCIHDGFGLRRFKCSLSGPEYAQRFIDEVEARGIPYLTDASVIDLSSDRIVTVTSRSGVERYQASAIVLAMGCRERTRHALSISGTRPAGIYTAGVAQTYVNLQNTMPGREIVILGSGDIGMIMARRMTLEGAHVRGVFEVLPYASGLPRNVEQCLNDYDIPLVLSHTVIDVIGTRRLEAVRIAQVDEQLRPIRGSEVLHPCDTLILSVGLIPENELSVGAGVELDPRTHGAVVDEGYETSVPGIFAAGNVLHVHDLVDSVSREAEMLAVAVVGYLNEEKDVRTGASATARSSLAARPTPRTEQISSPEALCPITADAGIGYTVPQAVGEGRDFTLSLRVREPMREVCVELRTDDGRVLQHRLRKALPAEMIQIPVAGSWTAGAKALAVSAVPARTTSAEGSVHPVDSPASASPAGARGAIRQLTCIMCPTGCDMEVEVAEEAGVSVRGARCRRGEQYARRELSSPMRNIASSVSVDGGELPLVSVRLTDSIPKALIADAMGEIRSARCRAPVAMGEVLLADICGTGADAIATKRIRRAAEHGPHAKGEQA